MKNIRKIHEIEKQQIRKVPAQKEREIDDALGLQLISLRLQKDLINNLKELAREEGIGYQPLIRQILKRHVRAELKRHKN